MKKIIQLYEIFLKHPSITTDSRQVKPGDLFFALKGDRFNGNEYASAALDKGAAFAVIDEKKYLTDERCILVDEVLSALQQLARHHRQTLRIPILAITGTNGKTTTKELIHRILSEKYKTLATQGNLNNHIGVPMTLLNITSDTEMAVIEMGANHPGEIHDLCEIADPGYGIITNIGKAHLEGFGGFEGVIKTKTELYKYLKEKKGTVFVNEGNPILAEHTEGINTVGYNPATEIVASPPLPPQEALLHLTILKDDIKIPLSTNLFGAYNAENILAAVTIGIHFGVDPGHIKKAIENYIPANNRSQVQQTASNLLVLDMYNANPTSMEAALRSFASSPGEIKTVILGDMLELGEESDSEHLKILELLDQFHFAAVYLVGPFFTRLNTKREWICFQDADLGAIWMEHHKIINASVLVKGSRGIRLEKLVPYL